MAWGRTDRDLCVYRTGPGVAWSASCVRLVGAVDALSSASVESATGYLVARGVASHVPGSRVSQSFCPPQLSTGTLAVDRMSRRTRTSASVSRTGRLPTREAACSSPATAVARCSLGALWRTLWPTPHDRNARPKPLRAAGVLPLRQPLREQPPHGWFPAGCSNPPPGVLNAQNSGVCLI